MTSLFVDTTNSNLILILFFEAKIIVKKILKNQTRVSDIFSDQLNDFLKENKISLKEIKNFYVIYGPGSFTGIRVGVTFVKTIWTINPVINVYQMSSLKFQAPFENSISILDAKGNKSYLAIKDSVQESEQLIENDQVSEILNQYPNYQVFKDYEKIDEVIEKFLTIIPLFERVNNIEQFNPLYLKELFSN